MLHFVIGRLKEKKPSFAVVENAGFGLKLFINESTYRKLPSEESEVKLFSVFRIHEENAELYGFLDEPSLKLFELLHSVSGVGPKSALSILNIDSVENITASILEKRADMLTKASGIGKKIAERIVLELHTKIEMEGARKLVDTMDENMEAEEALVGLGYDRRQARQAVRSVPSTVSSFEERLRTALRILGKS